MAYRHKRLCVPEGVCVGPQTKITLISFPRGLGPAGLEDGIRHIFKFKVVQHLPAMLYPFWLDIRV